MSEPAAPPSPEPQPEIRPSLESVRAAMDAADEALLAQLLHRAALSDAIAAAKSLGPRQTPLRPAREVQVLRRLLAKTPPQDADLVFEVWRAISAASVRRQRPIEVFVAGGADPNSKFELARRHFGAFTKITRADDPRSAIAKMQESPCAVAVAPFPSHSGPGVWWPLLSESRFHNVSIAAALPLRDEGEPEAAVLVQDAHLEPAGGDQTLALAHDPHFRLQRGLADAGLAGREIARSNTTNVLIGFDGFIPMGDGRLATLAGVGISSLRIVGAYARV